MMRAAPGNPYSVERKLPPAVEANMKANLGLDQPIWKQFADYVFNALQGDLGPSMRMHDKSVTELIAEGLPVSLTVGLGALIVAIIIGCLLGAVAALRQTVRQTMA